MLKTEKTILVPTDAPRRPELERALQAEGWRAVEYSAPSEVQERLSSGSADAVILHGPGGKAADMELVKVVRKVAPETVVIGYGTEEEGCDASISSESTPREIAVAARLGAALREMRLEGRSLREQLKKVEEHGRMQVERIAALESQCSVLREWTRVAQEMAMHDDLTGLRNRRFFLNAAEAELDRARRRQDATFAIVMLDIDKFKHYNDAYGHDIGDIILKHFAQVLVSNFRKMDTVARYGGEEFVVLLPDTDGIPRPEGTGEEGFDPLRLVNRLRNALKKDEELNSSKYDMPFTISAGVVIFPADGKTIDELVKEADVRLYRAKAAGRNRVCATA